MSNVFHKAEQMNEDIIGFTMLVAGFFVCYWGGKFFKHVIFFVGFVIGALVTYYVTASIWHWFHSTIQDTTRLYMSLTFGALMGILCVVVYKAAVLSLGAVGGVILAQLIYQVFNAYVVIPDPEVVQLVCILVGAALGGFLAFKFVAFVLKGVTAFVGSFMFSSGVNYFIERWQKRQNSSVMNYLQFFTSQKSANSFSQECDWHCYLCLALWMTLFISGAAVQYKLHGKLNAKDLDDDISEEEEGREENEISAEKKKRRSSKKSPKGGLVEVASTSPRQSQKAQENQFDYDYRESQRGLQYV